MRLSDIFSGAIFKPAPVTKEQALDDFDLGVQDLVADIDAKMEDAMEQAEEHGKQPKPITLEKVFKNLSPADIDSDLLESHEDIDFLRWTAETENAKLSIKVTGVRNSGWLWQDDKGPDVAKLTITLDLGRPYSESTTELAAAPQKKTQPQAAVLKSSF